MSDSVDLQPIKDKLSSDGSIFVLFGANSTIDHVSSSLALYLTLKQASKDVLIASPAEMRAEYTYLVGLDKIGKSIGNRNLVISFDNYSSGSIDKVTHNDDVNNKFELTIQPKSGHKAPNPKDIEYFHTGAQADLVFIIGTARLEDLGSLYESERKLFSTATTVSINRHQNSTYANINVIDSSASSLSEIMAEFIEKLDFNLKGDIASNLLSGIDFATNRFQNPLISSNAFTIAGKLINAGGKRSPQRITSARQVTTPRFTGTIPSPLNQASKSPFAQAMASVNQQANPTPVQQPPFPSPQPSVPNQPQPTPAPLENPQALISPSEGQENQTPAQIEADQNTSQPKQNDKNPPQEWMKPKIYKGSTRV